MTKGKLNASPQQGGNESYEAFLRRQSQFVNPTRDEYPRPAEETGKRKARTGDKPGDRMRWFIDQRKYPFNDVPEGAQLKAVKQTLKIEQEAGQLEFASSTNWQLIGPRNFCGRVNSIAIDPNNTARIFVCTSSGGVWRSTNGGASWDDVGYSIGTNFTGIVGVSPHNGNIVFVATGDPNAGPGGIGLFRSTNGGASFAATGFTAFARAYEIVFHPTNANTIWLSADSGVWRSIDGGATWVRQLVGWATGLVINRTAPNTLFCGLGGSGVWRTNDGGVTWTQVAVNPGAAFQRVCIAMARNAPNNMVVSFAVGDSVSLWKTSNGGTTWAALPDPPVHGWGQLWYNHYITMHPNNPNIMYSGQGPILRTTNGGAGGGTGPGKAWQDIGAAIDATNYVDIHVDHHCMVFDPVNPNIIYCGCDGGIYRSRFGGNYWENIGASIPSSEFYAIGQGVQEHYQVGGGTQDNGTWMTDGSMAWRFILGGDGFYFVVDPTNPNTVYAEWQGLNVCRSDNKGVNFGYRGANGIMEADPKPWMGVIEIDKNNPNRLYVGSDRLYRSDNRMDNWNLLSCGDHIVMISPTKGAASRIEIDGSSTAAAALGLSGTVSGTNNPDGTPATFARLISTRKAPFALTNGSNLRFRIDGGPWRIITFNTGGFANIAAATSVEVCNLIRAAAPGLHVAPSANSGITAIKVAPNNSNVVYAAAGPQLWRSTNAGASWTSIFKSPLPDRWITDIDVAANNSNVVYVTFSGWGTPHVYRSANGGSSWAARSGGLPDTPANTIVIDPTNDQRLWVGTDNGVFVSADGGQNWGPYSEGLPRVVITSLQLHRNTGLLRAGTYGRAVWERQATNLSLQISSVRTASNGTGDKPTFQHTTDALALTIDVAASPDLINLGEQFDAVYQIIDAKTNKVVKQVTQTMNFSWGQFFWISSGNNWGPAASDFTTPQKWGIGPGVYYFRAALSVRNTNVFAVSSRKAFRVV